jgi:spermidine synthase
MKRHLFILYFFLSGMCGLIYEVVWVRLFGLVVGVTIYSFTTVLVAFMSGLALGGYLGGRYADKTTRNPLRVYGILELAVGIYALIIPFLIKALEPLFSFFYQNFEQNSLAFLLIRFFICTLVLMVPTTMMGATLPVLVRHAYAGREHFGWTTGRLYAVNTLGAVFGSFIGGFVLIPVWGQSATIYAAAAVNLLIFSVVFLFHREREEAVKEAPVLEAIRERLKPVGPAALVVLAGYGLSGAAAMSYQVAWTNALILSIGTTIYAVGLILTAFISGLGIGGAAMSPFADRIKRPLLWAGIIEILIALSAVAVVPAIGRLPLWVQSLQTLENYNRDMAIRFLVTFGLIFIPTFLMGALLPVICRVYGEKRGGAGRAMGHIYSSNTLGSVIGSFLTGIFLISWLGLRVTIFSSSVMSLLVGAAFLLFSEIRRWKAGVILASLSIILGISIWLTPPWRPEVMNLAPYIYGREYEELLKEGDDILETISYFNDPIYYKEGTTAVVSVTRDNTTQNIALLINGKVDASSKGDMPTQILTGHLPMILCKNPHRVMVLGLASGVSLGSVTLHPVEEIDCLEISPEVVEASHFFDHVNHEPLSDPRVNMIVNDGRHHLTYTKKTYDVIISEPSNPWISGMGVLFTKEFFELARERLNPSGVFLCWVGVYNLDEETTRLFIRTFGSVFPEMTLWESIPGSDYLLMGSRQKFRIDFDQYMDNFSNPKVAEDLKRINETPLRVLARFLMGPEALARFAGKGPIHTDDKREMEYILPRRMANNPYEKRTHSLYTQFFKYSEDISSYLGFSSQEDREKIMTQLKPCIQGRKYIMQSLVAGTDPSARHYDQVLYLEQAWGVCPGDVSVKDQILTNYYSRADSYLKVSRIKEAAEDLIKIIRLSEQDTLVYDTLGKISYDLGNRESARQWYETSLKIDPEDAKALFLLGLVEFDSGQNEDSRKHLEAAIQYSPEYFKKDRIRAHYRPLSGYMGWRIDAMALDRLGELSLREGKLAEAENHYRKALLLQEDFERARLGLAMTLINQQRFHEAVFEYNKILEKNPDSILGHFYLGNLLSRRRGSEEEARMHWRRVLELDPNFPAREFIQARLQEKPTP